MVKPHVGIKVKESAIVFAGIQVEACCPDRFWPTQHRGDQSRAQDQGLFACALERSIPREGGRNFWRRAHGSGSYCRARAGTRPPTFGAGDPKKSLEAAPLDQRIEAARELGKRYP